MIRKGMSTTIIAAAMLLLTGLVGCSDNNPLAPTKTSVQSGQDNISTRTLPSAETEVYGRVATTDAATRQLTLVGKTLTITVMTSAEIVFKGDGDDQPIPFGDIKFGDSVDVRGFITGTLMNANRVRVRPPDSPGTGEVEFGGRVESINLSSRQIVLVNDSRQIFVAANAELVQRTDSTEIRIGLDNILPGDSVDIKGYTQADNSISAVRVRVRLDQSSGANDIRYDLEFKDTIAAIDYAAGTIQTKTGWLIRTDSLTIFYRNSTTGTFSGSSLSKRGADDSGDDDGPMVPLTLADFQVGDFIEVHANVISDQSVYAVAVELEDGAVGGALQTEFKATIASIDAASRTISFQNRTGSYTVHADAALAGFNNEPLTLTDFAAGMLVEVKAFTTASDTFVIVRMHRDNTL